MPGPTPKPSHLRQRTNREVTANTFVDNDPVSASPPALPKREGKWHPAVTAWWSDLWTSPMASEFIRSDVHGLFVLANLMHEYWEKPNTTLAGEIRLQRQCFGLTPIDRRRLQWEIQRGEEAEAKRKPAKREGPAHNKDPRGILGVV